MTAAYQSHNDAEKVHSPRNRDQGNQAEPPPCFELLVSPNRPILVARRRLLSAGPDYTLSVLAKLIHQHSETFNALPCAQKHCP